MNEKLLQYLWNFKIFKSFDFKDVDGSAIEIIDFGKWNFDSGPDFLYAKIKHNGLLLAGHIELHVKSSDWIFHRHAGNPEFENLILHAVYQHDVDIEEFSQKNIPTLELAAFIDDSVLAKYASMLNEDQFIACASLFSPKAVPFHFAEELLLKKLDQKAEEILRNLKVTKNNFEAVLFHQLAYAFGLKVNAEIFRQIAENIDFSIINKVRQNLTQLESLLFGMSNWLEKPLDAQMQNWKREFDFLKTKYQLSGLRFNPKFSKLRPPNFPTIRLSQLASLFHLNQNLFSKLIAAKDMSSIDVVFNDVKASDYWVNHFNFGKESTVCTEKYLTQEFINLIIINAVLPVKYAYNLSSDEAIHDEVLKIYKQIAAEKNTTVQSWKSLGMPIDNALQSQAMLFQYKEFCLPKNCLQCGIGLKLLKK